MNGVLVFMLLGLLAGVDGALSGFRAAAGRSGLIRKSHLHLRAMGAGLRWTVAVGVVLAFQASNALANTKQPDLLWAQAVEVGGRLLQVYLPCAVVIGAAYSLRLLPSVDMRSFTNTLVFGPFTLLRPFVAVAGMVWAVMGSARWEVSACAVLGVTAMLLIEPILCRVWESAQAALGSPVRE